MLCLTRGIRQRTLITVPPSAHPTEIWVSVNDLSLKHGNAVLGFVAPVEVRIVREEVMKRGT